MMAEEEGLSLSLSLSFSWFLIVLSLSKTRPPKQGREKYIALWRVFIWEREREREREREDQRNVVNSKRERILTRGREWQTIRGTMWGQGFTSFLLFTLLLKKIKIKNRNTIEN